MLVGPEINLFLGRNTTGGPAASSVPRSDLQNRSPQRLRDNDRRCFSRLAPWAHMRRRATPDGSHHRLQFGNLRLLTTSHQVPVTAGLPLRPIDKEKSPGTPESTGFSGLFLWRVVCTTPESPRSRALDTRLKLNFPRASLRFPLRAPSTS